MKQAAVNHESLNQIARRRSVIVVVLERKAWRWDFTGCEPVSRIILEMTATRREIFWDFFLAIDRRQLYYYN